VSEKSFVAENTFRVRYSETDAQGIVHHSSYIAYLEEGRLEYIRQRGTSYTSLVDDGYFLSVTEVNARYLRPAIFDNLLTVRCWISQLRSRGMTFEYEILNADTGEQLLTGYSKHICVNHQGQVARMPETWQKWVISE
jgi:acyl-CoA thioester hydrolase